MHFAELSRVDTGAYPLYDFTSGGLTHVNEAYPVKANRYRVAGPYVAADFGLIEIDWDAQPTASIRLQARAGDGSVGFERRVPLDHLR